MRCKTIAFACSIGLITLAACDRSPVSRQVDAVPDYSQYGVITAPQTGTRLDQPNIEGQLGVTTATTATSPEGAADRLGNKPADAAGGANAGQTTGSQPGETGTTATQ